MNELLVRFGTLLLTFLCVTANSLAQGPSGLKPGERFEIVGELYAHGVAIDLDVRKVTIISVVPLRLSGPEIISRQVVPLGTILTIVDRAPKQLLSFLYPDRYFVRLNDMALPAGVPVVIDLSRGVEGTTTPLNPKIFKPRL
jgi:hypothetical protein